MSWSLVYKKAIQDDGTLLFPERLSHAVLEQIRRTQGSYMFANQYQNEILPDGDQPFKKEWIRYYSVLPKDCWHFAFVDPAISQESNADYTAIVVVAVDTKQDWYIRHAARYRATPSEIIDLCFKLQEKFKCMIIGIEAIAYQKALLYMVNEEMRRRNIIIPAKAIVPGNDKSKETRILGLIPRFEWSRIFLNQGQHDLELELAQFPRGAHDDLIDALSQLEQVVMYPTERKPSHVEPAPNSPEYESWYIKNKYRESRESDSFE